jgi:peptidoglycan-N-acetylglucosamine deacetylase
MKGIEGGKYLMFGFDMETDVGSTSRNYEGVQKGTGAIMDTLEKHGARATFFFTGDCALKNRNILELVHRKGYEVGCHSMFHEDMGEPSFATSSQGTVLEEELEHRLEMNRRIVSAVTGEKPVSFRSPRGFGSNNLMRTLKKLGFLVDSSYMQSMHLKRNYPYFVSDADWREEGPGDILEAPLFAFDLANARDNNYQKKLDCWPRIRTHGAKFVFTNMKPIVEAQMREKGSAALAFYLHPWEFHPMPRSITYAEGTLRYDAFLFKNTGDAQTRELDAFLSMCTAEGFRTVDFRTFRGLFTGAATA